MDGDLRLVAAFPDRDPVVLSGIVHAETKAVPPAGKHSAARRKTT